MGENKRGAVSGKILVIGLGALVGLTVLFVLLSAKNKQEAELAYPPRLPRAIAAADLPDAASEGAQLLQRHCVECHVLPDPSQFPAEAWPRLLSDMQRRMQTRVMRSSPSPVRAEWLALEAYLQAHALEPAVAAEEAAP